MSSGIVVACSLFVSANLFAQSRLPAIRDRAVESVALTSGERLLGMVVDRRQDGSIRMVAERSWLAANAATVHDEIAEREPALARESANELVERLKPWRDERQEPRALAIFIERELTRAEESLRRLEAAEGADELDEPSQLLAIEIEPKRVRAVHLQSPERKRLLAAAWESRLADVADRTANSLALELAEQAFDPLAEPDLSDRLPPSPQDDRQWAARVALVEYSLAGEPHVQGTGGLLVRAGGTGEPAKLEQLIGGLLGDRLVDVLGEAGGANEPANESNDAAIERATRDAEKDGFRGLRVTQLDQDLARGTVEVRGRFLALINEGKWVAVWEYVEAADATVPRPEIEARIADDPQVKRALAVMESLGLSGGESALGTALRHGAATMAAQEATEAAFNAFLLRATRRLDGPPLEVGVAVDRADCVPPTP